MKRPLLSKSVGRPKPRVWWGGLWRYAVAVGAVGVAAAARWQLTRVLGGGFVFMPFYPAVAMTAMLAGARAGLLATVLSALAVDGWFQEPRFSFKGPSLEDLVSVGFFMTAGVLMSIMAGMMQRARRQEAEGAGLAKGAEALRRSEEQFRTLFEDGGVAMCVTAVDGTMMRVNRVFCRIMGYAEAELTGRKFIEITHPEDVAESLSGGERMWRGEVSSFRMEKRYIRKDGAVLWGDMTTAVVRDERGVPTCSVTHVQDVTERKRAEAALLESERKFKALFDNSKDAIFVYDMAGHFVDANQEACERLGYSREELFRMGPQDIESPGAAEKVPARLQELRERGHALFETEHQRRDGVRVMVEANCSLVELEGAQLVFSTCRDITARAQIEARLKASESTLRSVYETAPLMMGVVEVPADNSDILHIYDNPATHRFFGRSRGSLAGQSALAMGAPEGAVKRWIEQYRLAERGGQPVQFEYWHPRETGTVWLSAVVARIGAADSGGTRFSYVVAELTDRKRVEEQLQHAEARLAQAVQVAGLGIFEHDHRSGVVEYSPIMRELLGFGAKEPITIEATLQRTVPEDREALAAAIRRAHDPAGDGLLQIEYRVAGGDGRIRWISKRSQTFFDGEGNERQPVRTIGAALDVTARKEVQAELERLLAERTGKLQEMVEDLEHFSYTITHDLKSPLRAMQGFAEMAGNLSWGVTRPEAQEAMVRISTSAERMNALITDALNYSRSIRQELPLTDVDTGELLRGMLESYPELQRAKAQIQVQGRMPVVVGNEAGLTQCFSNLLGNAVKFVKPGERPQIRVWAEPLPSAEGGHEESQRAELVKIWVEDKGIGISKEMLPRVFHMFSRGSKQYEGTGIGLALVRKAMKRMGGRAGVESEEGKGSRFWLELKLGALAKPQSREHARPEARGGMVLYVEDEESDAMFMTMAFAAEGLGSALRVVGDGRTALEYLSGAGKYGNREEYPLPSAVLLDLNLPQLTGFEVLEWMRKHPDFARTPVVVFSSSTREDDRVKALELGANEFVAKPSSGLHFGEVVKRLRQMWMEAQVGAI